MARALPFIQASVAVLLPLLASVACSEDGPKDGGIPNMSDAGDNIPDGGSLDAGADADAGSPICSTSGEVPCEDESFIQLGLFQTVSTGSIAEEGTPGDFLSYIDATGGDIAPTESYVYIRFTEQGLEKLDISDEEAFASVDWDFAMRRFVARLNSGVSGPSCAMAARTAPSTDFDTLTTVPDGLEFRTEEYFTGESCEFIPDGSGFGSPGTALSSFWTYADCLQMTGNIYILALRGGRYAKLRFEAYYPPSRQTECNETGVVSQPSGSGNVRIRWAFIASE